MPSSSSNRSAISAAATFVHIMTMASGWDAATPLTIRSITAGGIARKIMAKFTAVTASGDHLESQIDIIAIYLGGHIIGIRCHHPQPLGPELSQPTVDIQHAGGCSNTCLVSHTLHEQPHRVQCRANWPRFHPM